MRRYGCWGGNPEGTPEDKTQCAASVTPSDGIGGNHQCTHKRGHGIDGLLCKMHAKMVARLRNVWIPKDNGGDATP